MLDPTYLLTTTKQQAFIIIPIKKGYLNLKELLTLLKFIFPIYRARLVLRKFQFEWRRRFKAHLLLIQMEYLVVVIRISYLWLTNAARKLLLG